MTVDLGDRVPRRGDRVGDTREVEQRAERVRGHGEDGNPALMRTNRGREKHSDDTFDLRV